MVQYCLSPSCRRRRLLEYFGEQISKPSEVCNSTCDFCADPDQITKDAEAAGAVNEFSFHPRASAQSKIVGSLIEGEDDFRFDDFVGVDDMLSEGYFDELEMKPDVKPKGNAKEATSVLEKYETIECRGAGFVNFREKSRKTLKDSLKEHDDEERKAGDDRLRVPSHLMALASTKKRKCSETTTSTVTTAVQYDESEMIRLKAELAKAQERKEDHFKKLVQANSKNKKSYR